MVFFRQSFDYIKHMNLRYKKTFKFKVLTSYYNSFSNRYSNQLRFGLYGISVCGNVFLNYTQVNSLRIKTSRLLKRVSRFFFKLYFRIFFTIGFTRKPALTRMGKGAGLVKEWFSFMPIGGVLIELNTIGFRFLLKKVLLKIRKYLPCDILFLTRLS